MSREQTLSSSFLYGGNGEYVAELYAKFLKDRNSVDSQWSQFFGSLGDEDKSALADMLGASWNKRPGKIVGAADGNVTKPAAGKGSANTNAAVAVVTPDALKAQIVDSMQARSLIRAYRVRGHLLAQLDPLGLMQPAYHADLDPGTYGFSESDYDRPIFIGGAFDGRETITIRELLDVLRQTYCGHVGIEFMHMQDPEARGWIQSRVESNRSHRDFTVLGKRAILDRLTAGEGFEKFLQVKYTGTKRFGLEGGESLIPAMEQIIKKSGQLGVKEIVFGMAHRGRLNMLANVLGKPYVNILSEFQGNSANPDEVQGSGDVKYHLGTSSDRTFDGVSVHLTLSPNPSHLEAVNPVVLGRVRAKQDQKKDRERGQVLGVLLHGDAAFAGQGIVPECFGFSDLPGYRTGGTIHFIINNQVGFTTSPTYGRSSPYSSDVAKTVQAPIFHVNGDDPEAVVYVAGLAAEFRQQFKRDVVVDMLCYRRQGHNETDEPAFTQPIMYQRIASMPTTRAKYAEQLAREEIVSERESKAMVDNFNAMMEREHQAAQSYKPNKADWLEGAWSGLSTSKSAKDEVDTGVKKDVLGQVINAITSTPQGFNLNSKIARQLEAKKKMFESGEGFDWATGEALAFGSLLTEGYRVRISGQDVGRGTFSHRHCILHDQKNAERYLPLQHINDKQAEFEACDSPLSEFGVMGFDYGYSLAEPRSLVCWEGQFGDFVNGAQVMIDQFISSAESKWLRMSGLVLLLPHGFEGQGPEHSSARPERFLQLCAEDNMVVGNCTTPANYFHALRRQLHRPFRKPLILMTPKSLLRHKLCVSTLDDFLPKTSFQKVIPEAEKIDAAKCKRVVLCSGKVYYDLLEARTAKGIKDVALIRVEQYYPYPDAELQAVLKPYKNADIIWCQEEPENMGAWNFLDRRIEGTLTAIKHKAGRPVYVGRPAAASPATGSYKRHNEEQAKLVKEALGA
ncbi:MAG: 2-oxoglutarate dehydrogenase E1 component [Alphaproteobacteria bacterium]|nr:MAG: 2-oxoglutarate dehydrogenase E1 component [Alphaproteobacteria bacterium]